MPTKAPIYLKNAGGNKGNKGKLREILSTDMISAPLGDFRHTAHVGRGGSRDMFGDTSFIPNQDCLTTVLKNPSDGSNDDIDGDKHSDETSKDGSDQHEDQSNALQSALSLPHLKSTGNGSIPESPQRLSKVYSRSQENVTKSESPPESPSSTNETEYNVTEGPPKPKRVLSKMSHSPRSEPSPTADNASSPIKSSSASRADTENSDNTDDWKFELDMGPSLIDEIMGIIMTRPNQ